MKASAPSSDQQANVAQSLLPPVLADLSYRRLWYTGVLYYQSYWMEIVVTGWVVLTMTESATAVGVVAFLRSLPMFLFGFVFGSLSDRFPRLRVLYTIQVISLIAAMLLAIMFIGGFANFWLICIGTSLIGCAWAADFANRRALVSELNARENTARAMSMEALSMQGGKVIAPVVGGLLLSFGGPSIAYVGITLMFVAGIVLLSLFRSVFPGEQKKDRTTVPLLSLIRSGWSTATKIPIVRVALLITVIMNLLVFPYQQLISLVAGEILAVGPSQMGILAGGAGAGSAMMAGFLAFRGRPATARRFYAGGAILGSTLLMALAFSTNYNLSLALQVILGLCFGAFGAMQPALIVGAVEPEMRARAMGLLAMSIGTMPLGLLITGSLSSLFGPAVAIGGMAAVASFLIITIAIRNRALLRDSG